MVTKLLARAPALVCAGMVILCLLIAQPYVEMGVVDDWSYIKSAQMLADTHRLVYNGWATAMLGWQLFVGAFFIKIFGFSFTAVRASTWVVAMVCGYAMQRTLVRAGLLGWNATVVTLTVLLSPIFQAVTYTYMSDVFGMLSLVCCLYACLRALESHTSAKRISWIYVAALSNVLGGTSRQIAWLGALVMVPSVIWLLRRDRRVAMWGGVSHVLSVIGIFALLHWFNQQPYSVPEPILPAGLGWQSVRLSGNALTRSLLEIVMLSLPVAAAFVPSVKRNRTTFLAVAWVLGLYCVIQLWLWHPLIAPYCYNSMTPYGFIFFPSYAGQRPLIMHAPMRVLLSAITLAALCAIAVVVADYRSSIRPNASREHATLDFYTLSVLLVPCLFAYFALLMPRAAVGGEILDRYLIFPEFICLLIAVFFYQRHVRPKLPTWTAALVGIMALVGTIGLHDSFALFRAQRDLIRQAEDAGVSALAIDGGAQFNGWTELQTTGHVNEKRVKIPVDAYHPVPPYTDHDGCHTTDLDHAPSLRARYIVSFDVRGCDGLSGFAPVMIHNWLAPHAVPLYLVKTKPLGTLR